MLLRELTYDEFTFHKWHQKFNAHFTPYFRIEIAGTIDVGILQSALDYIQLQYPLLQAKYKRK